MFWSERQRLMAAAEKLVSRHPNLAFSPATIVVIAETFAKGDLKQAARFIASFDEMLESLGPTSEINQPHELLDRVASQSIRKAQ